MVYRFGAPLWKINFVNYTILSELMSIFHGPSTDLETSEGALAKFQTIQSNELDKTFHQSENL